MQVAGAVDFEFELNLAGDIREILAHVLIRGDRVFTCQLVAVRGTREEIHPCCDGRSDVRRTYLNTKTNVSTGAHENFPLNIWNILTCQRGLLYPLRSRTSGFGNPNRGMAVNGGQYYCSSSGHELCAACFRKS